LHLDDIVGLRQDRHAHVTIRIHKWHYHVYRVALTFVEGYHGTKEEMEKAIREGRIGDAPKALFPEDYPKHLSIVCRPSDLIRFANALKRICESE